MNRERVEYTVLGIMSGTSLDGLDIACCHFQHQDGKWNYKILDARTYPYNHEWRKKLAHACKLDGLGLTLLDNEFGRFTGEKINEFLSETKFRADLVASHGHTVFHQPGIRLTCQIGSGAVIASVTGIPAACDFRSKDMALGGQGAPLVPIGDELLFGNYDFCLNLGGFSNISFRKNNTRIAFDICPVNLLINHFTRLENLDYDEDGLVGSQGKICKPLLDKLNSLDFYQQKGPKSLSREWVEKEMIDLILSFGLSLPDILRTAYEHIAIQISTVITENSLKSKENISVLVTGGGAFNKFLVNLLSEKNGCSFYLPEKLIVNFKEALVFAFLGVLRIRKEINCLSSVTGAVIDNCGGAVFV